jgi:hypothetical protein
MSSASHAGSAGSLNVRCFTLRGKQCGPTVFNPARCARAAPLVFFAGAGTLPAGTRTRVAAAAWHPLFHADAAGVEGDDDGEAAVRTAFRAMPTF